MLSYSPDKFASEYATTEGQLLWQILNREDNLARMETATDLGQPALKPLEDVLLTEMGPIITDGRMKQMAGHMVRQIMEANGFEHDVDGIRLASAPFFKASRYKRPNQDTTLHIFRDSGDARQLGLTLVRDSDLLPSPPNGDRWTYYNSISSPLKASVGFGFDLKEAEAAAKRDGYVLHYRERIVRPA